MRIGNPGPWLRRRGRGLARWPSGHAVVLGGLGLIAGQLGWTEYLLARSYFRQTDFLLLDRALREGFGWKYLMWVNGGHLMPAGLAITWGLAHASLYDWPLANAVVMVLTATASLAMLRMLLTVFARPDGASPGILFPLAVYLFLPLSAGATAWLSVALRVLPFEVALFLAVDAHVRYLRGRRIRWLLASGFWVLAAMTAANQGALVPVLLFALTTAYFVPGRWRDSVREAAAGYWRAWLLYGALLVAYCVVFFIQLSSAGVNVPGPGKATSLYQFAGTVIGAGLAPGMLGGPWQWAAAGYAQGTPPAAAEYLSWIVIAIVVALSCFYRTSAWRAWAILLGWVVAASVLPAALAGFGLPVTTLGQQTGYLASAAGLIALCAGLAFLPAGEVAVAAPRPLRVAGVLACCCFAAGTVVSLQDFQLVNSAAARSYVTNARLAVAQAPSGTLVVDGPTPDTVLAPGFFAAQDADTAAVIGPLGPHHRSAGLHWVPGLNGLNGVYPGTGPMTFDADGVLRPIAVTGTRSAGPPRRTRKTNACWTATTTGVSVPLRSPLYRWPWTIRVAYSGPAGVLAVTFGSGDQAIAVPAGTHTAYLSVTGSGDAVDVQFYPARAGQLCVTGITVGLVYPDQKGHGIPAHPHPS